MASFVLVHGAWHGAWCWRKVVPALRERDHEVLAPDLPGHGEDRTPVATVSFKSYVQCVCDEVHAAQEPVILVGHSLGGMTVAQVAERVHERVAVAVYLCAFLPADGMSVAQMAATKFENSLAAKHQVIDLEGGASYIPAQAAKETFYGRCSDEDAAFAISMLVRESLAVQRVAVEISPQRGGSVPRMYIEAIADRAIPLEKQRAITREMPCQIVRSLDSDHSPFFSRPLELVSYLEDAARLRETAASA